MFTKGSFQPKVSVTEVVVGHVTAKGKEGEQEKEMIGWFFLNFFPLVFFFIYFFLKFYFFFLPSIFNYFMIKIVIIL